MASASMPDTTIPCILQECTQEDRLQSLEQDIGDAPDVTAPPDRRTGSGIKGALNEINSKLDSVIQRLDGNKPTSAWGKRVGLAIVILAIGLREAHTIYSEITGAHAGQLPQTTSRVP